ncbi:hypothetical protein Tco_1186179 [Tanacetum coccineum]
MCTRNSHIPNNSLVTIPRRQNRRRAPNVVEPELRTIVEVAPMAERTMEELLRAPTEGYGEAIVIPEINADHFEIKTNLLQLVQASPFHGFERENPHTHINNFKSITSTLKFRDVPNDVIKHLMFPYSLKGAARVVKIVSKKVVTPAMVKAVEQSCVTYGGAHAYYNCPNTDNNQSSVCAATGTYKQVAPPYRVSNHMAPPSFVPVQNNSQNSGFFQNQASTSGTLSSNTIPNPKGEMKAITTRSGVAYEGPSIPTNPSPKKTLPKPNIPYPLRLNDQKFREKASNQMEKIFQIFQDLRFDISFADALLLMPRFAPTIKNLLMNKEKLFELAKIPLNENCSVMLLKKLPEKLGDPRKFLIPCDFPGERIYVMLGRLGSIILKDDRALSDVYGEENNLGEECVMKCFVFSNNSSGGNPTTTFEPIISDSFLSFTPFEESDFILGDICLIEKLLNNDPFQLPPMNLKQVEVTKAKSSIEEPPELELKDLPSQFGICLFEGTDKLPVILQKVLKDEKKKPLKVA